ncbi:hypothetical protein BABINDRAFT_161405 [Babjeviella inositovora NRRL Y-12698]|uniref:Phospholipid/glycerol acyltransferase domain-containing protein n=1 Tax=Babjeviella inositovora NRRL Y-12698 TaxID=984486 RepID=A0A1E3QPS7_9ASCO|nr:uncharacterized protein BABINDRAFT_161405 [Babjeviella inositovora NRRL Y-12698]ODQ79685.1 hypothetical protein BABINDRAFT_161405 [Babjeviella inositovora NRRL Y-12698]
MEKFTTWRDKATGIAPFLPVPEARAESSLVYLSSVAFKTGLFVLKLPIFVVAYALFVAIPFVPAVSKFLARLILILFGFYTVDISVDGVKRTNRDLIRANHPNDNEIIVVNFTSPLDVIILSSITSNPVFAIPDHAGVLHEFSVTGIIKYALSKPSLTDPLPQNKIDFTRLKNKTVYIFAEGATSNNKAVLPFPANLQPLPKTHKLKSFVLRISPTFLTTPVPVSSLVYLYRALTNVSGVVKGRVVLLDIDINWIGIRDSFETAGKLRLVGQGLDIQSKLKFLDAYHDNEQKKALKKRKAF